MNKRKFIHSPEDLLKEGKRIVKEEKDKKYVCKVILVNFMLERKRKAEEISQMSGVPRRTLSRWVKDVDEKGFESLRAKKPRGRTSRLSSEQKKELKEILSQPAEEQGYYKWDGVTLSDYIKEKYDIDLKVRQCQRLFHELGFSRIRPQIFPSKSEQNEEARKEYKKNR